LIIKGFLVSEGPKSTKVKTLVLFCLVYTNNLDVNYILINEIVIYMTNRNDWWKPENLEANEKQFREIADSTKLDVQSDFGSYRKVLLTGEIKDSLLGLHNDLNPLRKIRAVNKLLKNKKPENILDAGCGMGYTTAALADFYKNANVLGVDVSTDAIEYSTQKHKQAKFLSIALSPNSEKLGTFDFIYCFEFYPFTRNSDHKIQAQFINYFSQQLSPNGKIVIYQLWENPTSLSFVIDKVIEDLPHLKFSIHTIPNPRLTQYLPSFVASGCGILLEKILGRKISKTVVLIELR
jgi:2-polyprenyl-3-methyl-5-hydroxy-6-metoxy-1,4-benzoquinol methylase